MLLIFYQPCYSRIEDDTDYQLRWKRVAKTMEIILMTGVTVLLGGGVTFLTHVVKTERRHVSANVKTHVERATYPSLRLVK